MKHSNVYIAGCGGMLGSSVYKVFSKENGNVEGAEGVAAVPKGQEDAVIESAEECPGECIMIEPD